MRQKLYLFVFFLVFWGVSSWAQVFQNVWVENFDNRNGLTQNTVWSITQDQQGFLWVGTDDGLLRYDGYQFKPCRARIGSSTGALPNNSVRHLLLDGNTNLWVGTRNGIAILNVLTDSIQTFLPNLRIRKLLKGPKGYLWVGTHKGLFLFDVHQKRGYCKIPNINLINAVRLDDERLMY